MLVQFTIRGHPFAAELTLLPGKTVADIDVRRLPMSGPSIRMIPLDQPFTEASLSVDELADRLPGARFDKRARVAFAPEYTGVLTTTDGAYVKKFYQASAAKEKLPFFENLLDHDHADAGGSPGIANRMLVGVPTADNKKSISPPGPLTQLRDAKIEPGRIEELKRAAKTAVDDLLIVARAGFGMPEAKHEHYLLDPTAETLEIKMIDFATGRYTSGPAANRKRFDSAADDLSAMLKQTLGQVRPKLEAAAISEFLQEIKDYAQEARNTRF